MSGWRFAGRLISFIGTMVAALLLLIPGLVIAVIGIGALVVLTPLTPDRGSDAVGYLMYVPSVLFLVVGVATWAPAAWRAREDREDRERTVGPADPGRWAEALAPLAHEVRIAGFRDVGWCTRGREPFLVLVSADGIVALVVGAAPGTSGTRPAADGSPGVITLLSPIVVGREIAHLVTVHAVQLGRRAAGGPVVTQIVPSGDPVAMATHHRAAAASLVAIGLPVPGVAPDQAPSELDRLHGQAARGVVTGLVPWLVSRHRLRHPETVTATTRPLEFERAVSVVIGMLPREERRPIAAGLQYRRALGNRPRPGPRVELPDRPPTAPPTVWPGG